MSFLSQSEIPPCAGCGQCCHLVVELQEDDIAIPAPLVVEHGGVRCMDQRANGACVALDPETLHCTVYDQRPQICRDFQRGSNLCRTILQKRWGISHGRLSIVSERVRES